MIKPDITAKLPAKLTRVHFVGIGGSGMSGIAKMFHERGIVVTGSDRSESKTISELGRLGIDVQLGHEPAAVKNADAVVVTGALWEDNPEYLYALANQIPVVHRSVALDWLSRDKRLISVAGAHGKTTTTGMLVSALRALGSDPSFVNGGVINEFDTSAGTGNGNEFVLEADESDGSFLLYQTDIGLVTNIDTDHLETYGSSAAFEQAFLDFVNGCTEFCVLSADDDSLVRIGKKASTRVVTFGESETADFRVTEISATELGLSAKIFQGDESATLNLGVPGRHNAINACGVVALLVSTGFGLTESAAALRNFTGTGRRFQLRGEVRGVRVYDDYAHHPVEVRAALATARSVVGDGRVIAIHQPHLYSRTRDMAKDFAAEYERAADFTVVLDVHGAREDPIPGVSGELVSSAFSDKSTVEYCPNWDDAVAVAAKKAKAGDIIMTLSCGDVYRIIPSLLEELQEK